MGNNSRKLRARTPKCLNVRKTRFCTEKDYKREKERLQTELQRAFGEF